MLLFLTPLTILLKDIYPAARFAPIAIALSVYILGSVHANIILSRLKKVANKRILEIEEQLHENNADNLLLEKGLLEWKVFNSYESAFSTWSQALASPECDSHLLNFVGVTVANKEYYEKAKEFFDRALQLSSGQSEKDRIEDNLSYIQKKLK